MIADSNPLITVITPTFNRSDFIEEAVTSTPPPASR